jgi:Ca-activated chloride channel family protein
MILVLLFLFASFSSAQAAELPLESSHYDVRVTGGVAEIELEQVFSNTADEFIEAVYSFPLDGGAAVDDMTIQVGNREIVGVIKEREEARKTYEKAKKEGRSAALTEQERANLFTQSVANIPPGETIRVRLHAVQPVERADGHYELVIPLVVGPRFSPVGTVSDEAAVTPPVAQGDTGVSVGIDVSIEVGVPVAAVESPTHDVRVRRRKGGVRVSIEDVRPNSDFVLRWAVDADEPLAMALVQDDHLMVRFEAPESPERDSVIPRELIWVIDTSGSQEGVPLDMAKAAMQEAFAGMNDEDRFALVQFADSVSQFSKGLVPATIDNLAAASLWVDSLTAGGGTNMVDGVYGALGIPADSSRERYVIFLTDGLIGNERDVLATVADELGPARLFTFGLGNGTNRWLLEEMALEGGGRSTFVTMDEQPEATIERFMDGIGRPVLSDIEIDWGDWDVERALPEDSGDLMAGQPLEVVARVIGGSGPIRIVGRLAGRDFEEEVSVKAVEGTAIGSLWARAHVAALERLQHWGEDEEVRDQILSTALDYRLLTRYTSFVAVDRRIVNPKGNPSRVDQPGELPDGMNFETSVSRMYTPPGDPLLTVDAPQDSRSVIAVYPWGEAIQMRWDELRLRWYDRFLVPRDVPDGGIEIFIFIFHADGSFTRRTVQMVVDSEADEFDAAIEHRDGFTVLTLFADEPLRTIQAQPSGRPGLRKRINVILKDALEYELRIPGEWDSVEMVVTDRAMNTRVQEVMR